MCSLPWGCSPLYLRKAEFTFYFADVIWRSSCIIYARGMRQIGEGSWCNPELPIFLLSGLKQSGASIIWRECENVEDHLKKVNCSKDVLRYSPLNFFREGAVARHCMFKERCLSAHLKKCEIVIPASLSAFGTLGALLAHWLACFSWLRNK